MLLQLLVHNAIKASGQDPAAMMGMTTRLFATLYPGELTPVGAVADAIDFLASDKSLHITGTDTPVDQARTLSFTHSFAVTSTFCPHASPAQRALMHVCAQGWAAGAVNMPS